MTFPVRSDAIDARKTDMQTMILQPIPRHRRLCHSSCTTLVCAAVVIKLEMASELIKAESGMA